MRALQFCKIGLICAVMIALATIGFAHQNTQPSPSPELAAYVAAGGSLADLCGLPGSDGQAPVQNCEACRISDSAAWTRIHCADRPVTLAKVFAFSFVAKRLIERRGLDAARLVRAPPHA
ncbi:hypothetical protein [Tateyamaria omphalii]|uniref:Uncharacterized protein n=1 Tax=Tateyamaria omphalii TaxID=299262 RepID=A0A1P8N0H8_9RHOB|nr:hypothetical protein [Tateyamaria omphalii]APX13840.1 hypothetical protein BWR18_11360 [Tateyamaria omphalii]